MLRFCLFFLFACNTCLGQYNSYHDSIPKITLSDTIFKEDALFESAELSDILVFNDKSTWVRPYFHDVHFLSWIDFAHISLSSELTFENVVFDSVGWFWDNHFKNTVIFENSSFKKSADFENCKFDSSLLFYGIQFSDGVEFRESELHHHFVSFYASYRGETDFNASFDSSATFMRSYFYCESSFPSFNDVLFLDCGFYDKVTFPSSYSSYSTQKEFTSSSSYFNGLYFERTKFEGDVNLEGANFHGMGKLDFGKATFLAEVNLDSLVLPSVISFYKVRTEKEIDLTKTVLTESQTECVIDLTNVDTQKFKLNYSRFKLDFTRLKQEERNLQK